MLLLTCTHYTAYVLTLLVFGCLIASSPCECACVEKNRTFTSTWLWVDFTCTTQRNVNKWIFLFHCTVFFSFLTKRIKKKWNFRSFMYFDVDKNGFGFFYRFDDYTMFISIYDTFSSGTLIYSGIVLLVFRNSLLRTRMM